MFFLSCCCSHSCSGYQTGRSLGITPHWVYHQIKRGTVVLQRDAQTRLFLFPDGPETLEAFGQLRAGHPSELRY